MKLFIFLIDDILTVFTCFLLVSSQQDTTFVGLMPSNFTTELPCNQENGCNSTETTTDNSEMSTSSNVSDVETVTVFINNQTSSCPDSGCQTETSSPKTETSTMPTLSNNYTSTYTSVEVQMNVTTTKSSELVNASEPLEESTTIMSNNSSNPELVTELLMIINDTSEFQTTSTVSLIKDSTQVTTTASSANTEANISMENSSSVYTEVNSTTTYLENIEINNNSTMVINFNNSSEIYPDKNFTTDISIETTTDNSNYTEKPTTNEFPDVSNDSFAWSTTEDMYNKTNFSLTSTTPLVETESINEISTDTDNTTITEPSLFITNFTTEAAATTTTTEKSEDISTEYFNQTEIISEKSDTENSTLEEVLTTLSDDGSTVETSTIISVTTVNSTVVKIDDLPTVTPHINYLTVEIKVNCSDDENQKEISSTLAEFLNTTLKDPKDCAVLRNITIVVPNEMVEFLQISQFLMEKFNSVQLVKIWYNSRDNKTKEDVTVAEGVTDREVVLYVSLGVCLGIVLLLAVIITCFKCLRRRSNKPLDLDVPHLNLRLEDYTLTRIPRPNTVYLDYFRGPIVNDRYSTAPLSNSVSANNSERGLIQPFDTSVIPLEDAKKLEDLGTPITCNESTCPPTPLRTFGRKDWKNADSLIYENIMSSSTEKLHSDFFKAGHRGEDNPSFAA